MQSFKNFLFSIDEEKEPVKEGDDFESRPPMVEKKKGTYENLIKKLNDRRGRKLDEAAAKFQKFKDVEGLQFTIVDQTTGRAELPDGRWMNIFKGRNLVSTFRLLFPNQRDGKNPGQVAQLDKKAIQIVMKHFQEVDWALPAVEIAKSKEHHQAVVNSRLEINSKIK